MVRSHGDLVQACMCWGGVHPALLPRSHSLFWGPSRAAGGREKEDPQLIHRGRSLCPGCSGPVRCGVLPRIPGAAWGSGRRAGEQGVEAEGRVDRDRGGAAAWCGRLSGAPGHESSARARLADPGAGRSCEPGRAERAAGGASERWEARERAAGSGQRLRRHLRGRLCPEPGDRAPDPPPGARTRGSRFVLRAGSARLPDGCGHRVPAASEARGWRCRSRSVRAAEPRVPRCSPGCSEPRCSGAPNSGWRGKCLHEPRGCPGSTTRVLKSVVASNTSFLASMSYFG